MKYRALDKDGDYQLNSFLQDSPECVGQAILTRLSMWVNEWFLDVTDGTPYMEDIVGFNTFYDLEIRDRILNTPNVLEITNYSSSIDSNRKLSVNATVTTLYGTTTISY